MYFAINRAWLCKKIVVTDLAVLNITKDGFELIETAPGVTIEEVKAKTAGKLIVKNVVLLSLLVYKLTTTKQLHFYASKN
jgi:acyl CoA:acetate/3-ketoacid CoA transferase beta subunit